MLDDTRDLGFNMSLNGFTGIAQVDSGRARYWYLDWRTDGCSAGDDYWKNRFRKACVRHDFNWKNLYEIEYYHGGVDSWTTWYKDYANDEFRDNLFEICNGGFECGLNANNFSLAVMVVPISNICYDHFHYRGGRGPIKVRDHPNRSCK